MKFNTLKNFKARKLFLKYEINKKILKFIFINLLNNSERNKKSLKYISSLSNKIKSISKVQLKNKCLITGRNNSINKSLSISRIKLRELIKVGAIYGYKKSVW